MNLASYCSRSPSGLLLMLLRRDGCDEGESGVRVGVGSGWLLAHKRDGNCKKGACQKKQVRWCHRNCGAPTTTKQPERRRSPGHGAQEHLQLFVGGLLRALRHALVLRRSTEGGGGGG